METFCEESERSWDLKEERLVRQPEAPGQLFSPKPPSLSVGKWITGAMAARRQLGGGDSSDREKGCSTPQPFLSPLVNGDRESWRGQRASSVCHLRGRMILSPCALVLASE